MNEVAGLTDAEANYLEALAGLLRERARELRDRGQRIAKEVEASKLVWKLENLPFKLAASGKCDWIAAAEFPDELRGILDSKGEFRSEKFHFVTTKDGSVLRFKRKESSA